LNQANSVQIGSEAGNPDILVKFFFTNPKHIPNDFPDRDRVVGLIGHRQAEGLVRLDDAIANRDCPGVARHSGQVNRPETSEMDRKHLAGAYKAGHGQLAHLGRVREGRVDTGVHVVDNLKMSHAGFVRVGLSRIGYKLVDAHFFHQRTNRPGVSDKWVVCLTYGTNGDRPALNGRFTRDIRQLASTTWQWCHVWDNPPKDGRRVITVNFGGRQADQKPQHAVVIRDHRLTYVPVSEPVAESAE
jgi:hypothetical protein